MSKLEELKKYYFELDRFFICLVVNFTLEECRNSKEITSLFAEEKISQLPTEYQKRARAIAKEFLNNK